MNVICVIINLMVLRHLLVTKKDYNVNIVANLYVNYAVKIKDFIKKIKNNIKFVINVIIIFLIKHSKTN